MAKHRRLAGCVPVRIMETSKGSNSIREIEDGIEVLLITSRSNPSRLVFPKGGVKSGEHPKVAALRETWEEAGVRGTIVTLLSPRGTTTTTTNDFSTGSPLLVVGGGTQSNNNTPTTVKGLNKQDDDCNASHDENENDNDNPPIIGLLRKEETVSNGINDEYEDDEHFAYDDNSDIEGLNNNDTVSSKRNSDEANRACRWFLLAVEDEQNDYPERGQRSRHWMSLDEALQLENIRKSTRELLFKLSDYLKLQGENFKKAIIKGNSPSSQSPQSQFQVLSLPTLSTATTTNQPMVVTTTTTTTTLNLLEPQSFKIETIPEQQLNNPLIQLESETTTINAIEGGRGGIGGKWWCIIN